MTFPAIVLRRILLPALLIFIADLVWADRPGKFTFATGFEYSSGYYGNALPTQLLLMPFSLRYEKQAWNLRVSVPYLEISGPANTLGNISNTWTLAGRNAERTHVAGWGDILVGASYNLWQDAESGWLLDLGSKVKFATANSDQGLGSGKSDQSLQADAYKILGQTTLMATLGYKWLGKPEGSTYQNIAYISTGITWRYSPTLTLGFLLDYRQAILADRSAPLELTLYVQHPLSLNTRLQTYLYLGSNDASPDAGLGTSILYDF